MPIRKIDNRPNSADRGYDRNWRKLREIILNRDPLCMWRGQNGEECLNSSTDVDHVIPRNRGGTNDESNLQGLCHEHHSQKTAREDGGFGRSRFLNDVMIVCGPPGAGKSSYVREQAKAGDLTIDLDTIWEAISGLKPYHRPLHLLPFVLAARDAMLAKLQQTSLAGKVWVIACLPQASERERIAKSLGARVVIFPVSAAECLRRISIDPARQGANPPTDWSAIVHNWWRDYTPSSCDAIITGRVNVA